MFVLVRLVRHADADPATALGLEADLARPLSAKGRAEIVQCHNRYDGDYDLRLAGRSLRCIQTVGALSGSDENDVTVFGFLTYHDPRTRDGIVADALYRELGDAPLLEYITRPGGHLIMDHGHYAWKRICGIALDNPPFPPSKPDGPDHERRVLIGCHGSYGAALAVAAMEGHQAAIKDVAGTRLNTCSAIDLWYRNLKFIGHKIHQ